MDLGARLKDLFGRYKVSLQEPQQIIGHPHFACKQVASGHDSLKEALCSHVQGVVSAPSGQDYKGHGAGLGHMGAVLGDIGPDYTA